MPSNKLRRSDQHQPSTFADAGSGVRASPPNNVLIWAKYSNPAKVKPDLAASITPTDLEFGRQYTALWTWIWESSVKYPEVFDWQ